MTKKVKIIVGSARQNRVGRSLTDGLVAAAQDAGFALEVLDLAEINLPRFDAPAPPQFQPTQVEAGKVWQSKIADADAVIVVTPEYNASIPGSLKDAIDYLYAEWQEKPAGIVSYGWREESSAAHHLVDILTRLNCKIAEPRVHMIFDGTTFAEDGSFIGGQALVESAKDTFVELVKTLSE